MAKFVPDIKTSRWVIIAPSRIMRPHDNTTPVSAGGCPFCPGTEAINQELYRVGGEPGDAKWQVRVIANKYPITDYHEVVIHSPDHLIDLDRLPLPQVETIVRVYRERYNFHVKNQNGQVMIFNNHDLHAGASIKHPHSQIVVVPRQINLDTIPREPTQNEVVRTEKFIVYCPDFSQWPYEIWLAPKESGKTFGEISDEETKDLALILQRILQIIIKKFSKLGGDEVPYNYYAYHGPDWYLRIIPRLIHRAGFELGTGLSVNIVDPAKAAEEYRQELV